MSHTTRYPRLRILSLLVTALMLVPALPSQAVSDDEQITFNGSGWGHGVGMSQYGAYGMALDGRSASQILKHYYTGTDVKDFTNTSAASFLSSDSDPLWVGLLQDRTNIKFKVSGGTADLCQGWDPNDSCITAKGGQTWRYHTTSEGLCVFERVSPDNPLSSEPNDCDGSIRPGDDTVIAMGPQWYEYSWGTFRLREVPGSSPVEFHVSFETAIEPYIRGIHEVFASWPSAALEAQAIASRSYVLSNASARGPQGSFSTSVKKNCWCHLYDDTRSQVFKGDYMYDFSSWQSAVSNTAGKVVAYGNTLVTAFYSSSSGGNTENSGDVWSSDHPWLVSVDDSWAHRSSVNNPMSSWTRTRTAGFIASKVGLDELQWIDVSHRPSGGVSQVVFGGLAGGKSKTVTRTAAWWMRSALGLPSHYFDVSGIASEASSPEPEPEPTITAYQITKNSSTPIGWVDGVKDNGDGTFGVRGWTLDFDTELPIIIHIYVDGKFAKGVWADNKRADVDRVHNNGDRHGFNTNVKTSDGSHRVCVYAINAPTKSGNPRIGCKTVNVSSPSSSGSSQPSASSASKPFGWIDGISISGGTLDTRGWAIDKDAADEPVPIHIYVDGKFFQGGPADDYRPDVHRAHSLGKNHGFEFSKSISSGSHRVCVYAINLPEKSGNPLLGCKTVSG